MNYQKKMKFKNPKDIQNAKPIFFFSARVNILSSTVLEHRIIIQCDKCPHRCEIPKGRNINNFVGTQRVHSHV